MVYRDIKKYTSIDDVFGDYDCIALLYEMRPSFGHWVALTRSRERNAIEFFDPYGYSPDEELDFVKPEFKRQSGQDFPYLSTLLHLSPYNVTYSNRRIQKKNKATSSCGRHVLLRCILRDLPVAEYAKLMLGAKEKPDDLVTLMTAFV